MEFRRGNLLYFVTVAEERQVTRAAHKLHLAQPALSRRQRDANLFERGAQEEGCVQVGRPGELASAQRNGGSAAAPAARARRPPLIETRSRPIMRATATSYRGSP